MKEILAVLFVLCMMLGLTGCGKVSRRDALGKVFYKMTDSKHIHEAVLYVENSDGSFSEEYGYQGRDIDTPMICASVTKLFTTACVLELCEERKLSLDDKISQYFDQATLQGLHIYEGHEYSYDLTVFDLLSQTSGLPDDLEDGDNSYLLEEDVYAAFEQNLERTKTEKPRFAPGTGNRANYANINFDLLGEILKQVEDKSLTEIYQERIFIPLEMKNTFLAEDVSQNIPYSYYGDEKFNRPLVICSSGAAGGCISTPRDLMIFIKAFWGGQLFDTTVIERHKQYKQLQSSKGPIRYGCGYMEIPLEGIQSLFMGRGELIGHCGTTGSFAFYYPEKDLYFVGDLSQTKRPDLPIRLIMQLAMTK